MTSTSKSFSPGDLIWAKMKGFPPWPAKVDPSDTTVDFVNGRVKVTFFGTRETAFMKHNDLFDYMEHRHQFEFPRKHKGFNEGVHEIRVAAGVESSSDMDPFSSLPSSSGALRQYQEESTHGSRSRRSSSKQLLHDAFLGGFDRKRTLSGSTKSRSRTSSAASMLKHLRKAAKRRRLDSESSNGSRRQKMISGLGGLSDRLTHDLFDQLVNPLDTVGELPVLDGDIHSLLNEDARSNKSRRSRASSRVFDEWNTRSRYRSGGSQGCRSRLVSGGIPDVFEELIYQAHNEFSPAALLQALDNLSSEDSSEGRAATPEAPAPMPLTSRKLCTDCGCECQLYGIKWRCTSKHCLKWNGVHESYEKSFAVPGPSSLHQSSLHDFSSFDDESMRATAAISRLSSPQASSRGDDLRPLELTLKMEDAAQFAREIQQHDPFPMSLSFNDSVPELKIPKQEKRDLDCRTEFHELKSSMKEKDRENVKEKEKQKEMPPHREIKTIKKEKDIEKDKRRVQVISPPGSPPAQRGRPPGSTNATSHSPRAVGRPKSYKVEKTPPIGENGQRNCAFCSGQVRPQMCGGNKHRWRCVDKKCRKWYGWVKSNDEIPRDLGKKGRWKELSVTLSTRKGTGNSETASQSEHGATTGDEKDDKEDRNRSGDNPPKKRLGRPPKQHGLKIRLKHSVAPKKDEKKDERVKRKYTKKKDKEAMRAIPEVIPERPKTPPSPLTPKEMSYRPSAMERRSRWWTSEKRRVDISPPRDFQTGVADAAAAFRIVAHAMRSAAVTRADEPGTVSGTLDLLMDTLVSTLAPLLSLLGKLPKVRPSDEVMQTLWNTSAVHTPMFQ